MAGASRGEGLGNKFLAHIREVDAIAHVVRCFEDANIAHVAGPLDPVADAETVESTTDWKASIGGSFASFPVGSSAVIRAWISAVRS